MAETVKNLGQVQPAVNSLENLYLVGAGLSAVLSSIVVCNREASPATFRLAHAVGGATDATKQYLYYDEPIPGNRTFTITLGITLSVGDVLRARSSNGMVTFNVYGSEFT